MQTKTKRHRTVVRVLIVAMKSGNINRWSEGGQEGRGEMTKPSETVRTYVPVTVPFGATPTGETPEHCRVGSSAGLDRSHVGRHSKRGVKGGKWHTLIDKVYDPRNLFFSARKVLGKKGAAGVDRQTVEDFDEHADRNSDDCTRNSAERPLSARRPCDGLDSQAGKLGEAAVGIPTVRDRVVQTALVQ